jgi:5-methylcytosine-specific restriction endonuclease McrA
MTKIDRQKVYEKFGGKCAYCGCELNGKWHVDHAEALQRHSTFDRIKKKFVHTGTCQYPDRDNIENCFPACVSCNLYKSTCDIETFRWKIGHTIEALNRDSTQYKFAERFGLIIETKTPVKFYFEKCAEPVPRYDENGPF